MYSSIKMAKKLRAIAVAAVILASMIFCWTTANADDSSNTVVKGVVYVGSDDGIYALDAATGEIIWITKFDGA
jgi:outer membrane protein assembly factor BamB